MNKQEFELLKSRGLTFRNSDLINASYNADENSIDTIIATENPALVIDWDNSDWYNIKAMREILIVDNESVLIPEIRQVPFLDSHFRWGGTDAVKGSIRDLRVEEKKVVGKTVISKTEDKISEKIREKHITNTSAGYTVFKEFTFRIKKGEKQTIKGREFVNDYPDGLDLVVRSKWQLDEGSAVIWGADDQSVFRSEFNPDDIINQAKKLIDEATRSLEEKINSTKKENVKMEGEAKTKTPEEILKEERDRISDINAWSKRFVGRVKDIDKLANEAVEKGYTLERFKGIIADNLSAGEQFDKPASDLDLSGKDSQRYNIWNLVRAVWFNNKELAKLEIECSNEIAKRTGEAPNGYWIDYSRLKRTINLAELIPVLKSLKREISIGGIVGGTATADELVANELMAGNFIDLLYNKMIFGRGLGIRFLTGLIGNITFPFKTASAQGYYIGEGDAAAESDIDFGSFTLSPKTVSAIVKYTRQAALQTTPAMEGLVLADVLNAIALTADAGIIQGSGSNYQPKGWINWDAINTSISGADFSYNTAVDMETELEDANVAADNLPFITTPLVRGALKKRKIETGQTAKLCEKNEMIGHPVLATKQMPANHIMLADPNEGIVGEWGLLDLQINRLNDDGGVKVIPFYSHDAGFRRPSSIVLIDDFS